ncbi:hypothetical protein TEH_18460 [Tetragenococcus halophilus NBRC 12172]|uniref:Uncharacterized protein n=1 Tax=Tetragenococcus halophilus (strain DSM 20338 / JCM 20259 / NCIMB 9735 / NBRC 12172) TaxID=945021 RepID=A0AAN1SJ89_TETHN|nr:hypothetical protein TEH_18460 [Tetragenococcus halophilus NBRC 12172]
MDCVKEGGIEMEETNYTKESNEARIQMIRYCVVELNHAFKRKDSAMVAAIAEILKSV